LSAIADIRSKSQSVVSLVKFFKWLLIIFNLFDDLLDISYFSSLGELTEGASSDAERAWAAIGGTIELVDFCNLVWVTSFCGLAALDDAAKENRKINQNKKNS